MDNSREKDLKALHDRFSDPTVSRWDRTRAHRRFQRIQAMVKDRGLTKLRYMLVRASRTGNADKARRIESQIRDYERRQPWYRPSTA